MNTKSIVFLAAIALVLVGCNKEKEDAVSTPVVSIEQQALPAVNNNAVPTTTTTTTTTVPATIPSSEHSVGQPVASQTPQEVVVMPSQTAPIVDSQNQIQPVQPMPTAPVTGQQSMNNNVSTIQVPVVPVTSAPTTPISDNTVTSTTTTSTATPPVAQGSIVSGPVTPATPGTGGLVMANEPTPEQNINAGASSPSPYGVHKDKPRIQQQGVVGNSQLAAPTPGTSMGTTSVVGQTTDVVGTKASFRKISPAKVSPAKDSGPSAVNGGTKPSNNGNTPSATSCDTPDDDD